MKNILMFDYDGVIVDSLAIFRKNFISACQSAGFHQVSEENFLNIFNGNMYDGMISFGIPREKIPGVLAVLKQGLMKDQQDLCLFSGIREMLEELAKENTIFIITSNLSEIVQNFLISKNIACYQDVVGGEKESSKVMKIEKIKKDFPGNNYFYIGDTRGDIVEGREAGAKTIAVAWGWHDETLLANENPDYVIHSPKELTELFAAIK